MSLMIQPTPAPKVRHPSLLVINYAYALCLIVLAVVQLMGLGGFNFAGISYQTPGLPMVNVLLAALEIFALPFVLRLNLSRAARFCSAIFSVVTPLFYGTYLLYLNSQLLAKPIVSDWVIAGGLLVLGFATFYVLNGRQALRVVNR